MRLPERVWLRPLVPQPDYRWPKTDGQNRRPNHTLPNSTVVSQSHQDPLLPSLAKVESSLRRKDLTSVLPSFRWVKGLGGSVSTFCQIFGRSEHSIGPSVLPA